MCRLAVDRTDTTVRIVLPHLGNGFYRVFRKRVRPEILNTVLKKIENRTPLSRKKREETVRAKGCILKKKRIKAYQ